MKVLVTGGGTGIGRAVARAIVAAGGAVAVAGRRPGPLEELAAAHPGAVIPLPADLTRREDRDALLDRAREALGGLTGFVHSAGNVLHEPPGAITEGALREQLEINLVAPLRLCAQALTSLDDGGAVVVVSSTLAVRPVPTAAAYAAAKAGMLAALKSFALAGAPRGLRFSSVLPGLVDTDLIRRPRPGAPDVEQLLESLRSLHPIGRLGEPEDVARAVLYLLTAPFTTGAELVVDGGLLLRE